MQYDINAPAQLDNMLQAGAARALRAWGGAGPLRLLPPGLELASRVDGSPDFEFDLIRHDDDATAPYALLTFKVQAQAAAQCDIDAVRAAAPDVPLDALHFEGGFLRLLPVGGGPSLPPALVTPQPLAWNDLGRAAFRLRLDGPAAILTEGLLRHAAIPLLAHAELEYSGMVAGVPLQVTFDPALLVEALRQDGATLVSRASLLARLGGALPLTWTGDPARYPAASVAAALLARLRATLAQFAPAPVAGQADFLQLQDMPPGRMQWDLSADYPGRAALCLTLAPFAALERLHQPDAWMHRSTLSAPGFGGWRTEVTADLPPGLPVRFAVSLHVPPTPGHGAIDTGIVELAAPGYRATLTLRVPAGEIPAFQVTTYCRWPDGVWERAALPLPAPANPSRVTLGADDFPAVYIRLGRTSRLAALATLHCVATGSARGTPFCFSATLDGACRQATLCCPPGADGAALAVEAVAAAPRAAAPVRLALPLRSIELDLPHFPGYGAQQVDVDCRFTDGEPGPLLLDMADDALQAGAALRLVPASPAGQYRWWSDQPFAPAYRWRQGSGGQWSAPRPASAPLHLALHQGVASPIELSEESMP